MRKVFALILIVLCGLSLIGGGVLLLTEYYSSQDEIEVGNSGNDDDNEEDVEDGNVYPNAQTEFTIYVKALYFTSSTNYSTTTSSSYANNVIRFNVDWYDENGNANQSWGSNGYTMTTYKSYNHEVSVTDGQVDNLSYFYYYYVPFWGIGVYKRYLRIDPRSNDGDGVCFGTAISIDNGNCRTATEEYSYLSNGKLYSSESDAKSNCTSVWSATAYIYYRQKYSITFDMNGGSGGPSNFSAYAGIGYSLPSTKPSRTGYTFTGWSRSSAGGTLYNPGYSFADSWVNSGDKWVANWTANTYGISFNAISGRMSDYASLDSVTNISGYSFSLNSNGYYESSNKGINNSYSLCRVNFTATANTSVTFYVINYAESNYDFGIFSNLNTTLSYSNTEDTSNVYRSFKGSSSSSEQSVTYNITSTGSHFIYIKYRKDGSSSTYNDSLQFRMSGKSVTYNSTYGTLPTPTRTGYSFIGWYKESSYTNKVTSSSTVSTASHHILYAKWEIETYTLTLYYQARGVTNDTKFTITSSKGTVRNSPVAYPSGSDRGYVDCTYSTSAATITIKLTNAGVSNSVYYFRIGSAPTTTTYDKLFTSSTDSYSFTWIPTSSVQKNIYIYQRYTITYNANGGSGTLPTSDTYKYKIHGTALTLGTNSLTKTSYTANGWNTNTSGTGTSYASGGSYTANASATLYADWTPKVSTIKVQLKTSTDGVNYINSATGGTVTVRYYYDSNNSPTQSSGTSVTSASATTVATNALISQTVTFTPKANSGYVFVGVSTSSTAPNSSTATTFTPTTSGATYTINVYFKVLSTNQLKYDSTEKYWYFEEGEYPQSYVGDSMNQTLTNNKANMTSLGNITYNNGSQNVNIPVYSYNGKKYAEVKSLPQDNQEWEATGSNFYTLNQGYKYTDKLTMNVYAYMANWADYGSGNMRIISCTEGGGWNIEASSGNINFAIYDAGVGYRSVTLSKAWSSLSSGWHMFTLTFDGQYARAYIDGVLQGTSEKYTSGKIGYNSANTIFVGAEAGSNTYTPAGLYFKGKIKNISILNMCLSNDNIMSLYNNGNCTLWFEVEPIRWRVTDYGASLTDYPDGWESYGAYKTNFTVVSDRVLTIGAITSRDVTEGEAFMNSGNIISLEDNYTVTGNNMTISYSSSNQSFTLKNTSTSDPYATISHTVNLTKGVKYKMYMTVTNESGGSVGTNVVQVFYAKNGAYSETYSLRFGGTSTSREFTAPETAEFMIRFDNDYGNTLIIKDFRIEVVVDENKSEFEIVSNIEESYKLFQGQFNNATGAIVDNDIYGYVGQQEKVFTAQAYSDGIRVASKSEIEEYLTDYSAKASDMVCFLLGCSVDETVDYWTRNLGTNLGNGVIISKSGQTKSSWLNKIQGVRLSMTMNEGSRIYQG